MGAARKESGMTDASGLLSDTRRELARFSKVLELLVSELDEATWRARPAPREWAPVEIVCHLRDEEAEDFGARLRVILEGGARFVPIDPERRAADRQYQEANPAEALAAFRTRRRASLDLLGSVVPDRLLGTAERPNGGRLSGLDLLASWVAHDRLHLQQLAGALARLWADRWAPLQVDYAGPIPYSGATSR
jgi:DinB superfamily